MIGVNISVVLQANIILQGAVKCTTDTFKKRLSKKYIEWIINKTSPMGTSLTN